MTSEQAARGIAKRLRDRLKNTEPLPQPTLPTMETVAADRAAAAGESLAAELSDRLLMPRPSISRATGEIEKYSPLFCGSSANPQPSLFNPPADDPPAAAERTSSVDTWRFYQQSKGEAEAAAAVLNCAAAHSYHHVLVPGYDDRLIILTRWRLGCSLGCGMR